MSSIIELDQNLYPIRMVKLTNGQAVFVSTFIYDRGTPTDINFESAGLFLVPKSIPPLMLNGQFCFWQFLENVYKVTPDLEGKLYPKMRGYKSVPLWIFGGAHDYE